MNLNKVLIFGNLTRDPELRALPSGVPVASFGIATNRKVKKGDGWENVPEFHNVTVFGKQAESCAQYLRKGSSAFVEGRMETRSWEKNGTKQTRTEVVAERVQFGPRTAAKAGDDIDQRPVDERAGTDGAAAGGGSTATEYPTHDSEGINPDDIPF